MPELKSATRTACKKHRCEWCLGDILPGEKYFDYVGVHRGEFDAYKLHPECKDDMDEAFAGQGEYEFCPGDGRRPSADKIISERET